MYLRAILLTALSFACSSSCKNSSSDTADTTANLSEAKQKEPAVLSNDAASDKHEHEENESHDGHRHHDGHVHQGKGPAPLGHRFEDADKWAKRFDKKGRKSWQMPEEVIATMQIKEGMAVVDIGAGTGYFLPYLSAAVGAEGTVLGLDIEKDMVRYMNERAIREKLTNVSARIVATDDPGLAPKSVDRVLIVNTWHHLPERVSYAKKLALSLKEGGSVAIVDFTMEADHGPKKSHRLLPGAIVKELKDAGLDAKVAKEKLPDQYIVIGSRR